MQVFKWFKHLSGKSKAGNFFSHHLINSLVVQVDEGCSILYLLTSLGSLHLFDIETRSCLYQGSVSQDPVISCVPRPVAGGVVFVTTDGQVCVLF